MSGCRCVWKATHPMYIDTWLKRELSENPEKTLKKGQILGIYGFLVFIRVPHPLMRAGRQQQIFA